MTSVTGRFKLSALAAAAGCVFSMSANAATSPVITIDSLTNAPTFTSYESAGSSVFTVARSTNGSFVASWIEVNGATSVYSLNLRAYNADGTPQGNAIQLATNTYYLASVAMDPNGNFAATWTDYLKTSSTGNVFLQRFAAGGTPEGSAIKLQSALKVGRNELAMTQAPAIAMDNDGDIAVAWTNATQDHIGGYYSTKTNEWSRTYTAAYKSDGTVIKAAKIVDSVPIAHFGPTFDYGNVDWVNGLAMYGSGNVVMSLNSVRNFTNSTSVLRLKSGLVANGKSVALTDVKNFDSFGADASGNFDIAWTDPADSSLHVSRHSSSNALLGTVVPLVTGLTPDAASDLPALAVAPTGSFGVTWGTPGGSGYSFQKNAQFFNADGTANGGAFVVASGALNLTDSTTACAVDGNGNLLVVWNDYINGNADAIQGSLISVP